MSEIFLNSLNESQKLAAQHIDGSLLILAGAGSGKTKNNYYKIGISYLNWH